LVSMASIRMKWMKGKMYLCSKEKKKKLGTRKHRGSDYHSSEPITCNLSCTH
jgi:hypothetical protein